MPKKIIVITILLLILPATAQPLFEDVTDEVFPDLFLGIGVGISFADSDNDGWPDLFLRAGD